MPERFVRRNAALDGNGYQRGNANTIRVNSGDDTLRFGKGSSGTSEKVAVTLNGQPPISITANASLTSAAHAGQVLSLNNAAGLTITLPAASGTGDVYRLFVATTLTGGSLVIQVANSSDYMRGQAWTIGAANTGFLTANTGTVATESDTVTANRTTSGLATQGDYYEFVDIAANLWAVEADYASSGTSVTPFSAAV